MRQIHEIWKDGRHWKVQCPNGIMTFKTKKGAQLHIDVAEGIRDHLGNEIQNSPFRGRSE
jgi:hypothetical protein